MSLNYSRLGLGGFGRHTWARSSVKDHNTLFLSVLRRRFTALVKFQPLQHIERIRYFLALSAHTCVYDFPPVICTKTRGYHLDSTERYMLSERYDALPGGPYFLLVHPIILTLLFQTVSRVHLYTFQSISQIYHAEKPPSRVPCVCQNRTRVVCLEQGWRAVGSGRKFPVLLIPSPFIHKLHSNDNTHLQ